MPPFFIYPDTVLEKLEFQKIIAEVKNHAKSPQAKRLLDDYRISTEHEEIVRWLEEVQECKQLILAGNTPPVDTISDIELPLKLLRIENSVLDAEQLVAIKRLTLSAYSLLKFFKEDEENPSPRLKALSEQAVYEKNIVKLIDDVIDQNKQVKDNASTELLQIRQSLSKKRHELERVFARLLSKFQQSGELADVEQSIRNGRRVIGIVAESKRKIGGVIHDQSDTGKTVYIEPSETFVLNNSIFDLEREEERELYKILRELTAKLAVYRPQILDYDFLLSSMDVIQAKARFAIDLGANYPIVYPHPQSKLKKAYHPLLFLHNKKNQKPTIPLDLDLNKEQHILVISGPNAGGKTICLKTVALLQVMLQIGLLIPADERSEMGIFQQLFLDIGDAQSIEYELSTYSSHLKTMKHFIDFADKKSLFLIDELGSGTDPALGGAIAEVILQRLADEKAFGVVTTHYLNLKVMANKVKGVINGAMSFDEENLLPLYKLIVGKPGSSHTFSIAQRSGLPKPLIDTARTLVDIDHLRYDHLLGNIELLEKQLSETNTLSEKQQQTIKQLRQEIGHKQEQIALQSSKIKQLEHAPSKTSHFQREAEKRLQKMLGEWEKKKQTQDEIDRLAKETQQALDAYSAKKTPPISAPISAKKEKKREAEVQDIFLDAPIVVGSQVKILHLDTKGKVVNISGKKVQVEVGGMLVSALIRELGLLR